MAGENAPGMSRGTVDAHDAAWAALPPRLRAFARYEWHGKLDPVAALRRCRMVGEERTVRELRAMQRQATAAAYGPDHPGVEESDASGEAGPAARVPAAEGHLRPLQGGPGDGRGGRR